MSACGCPDSPARTVTDPAAHAAFHQLVSDQGGPAGTVNARTLHTTRGMKTGTLSAETILDVRARESGKRASGALREASR